MLKGHVFVAAPDVPQDVRLLVTACGGRVVSSFEAAVTVGLVVAGRPERLDCAARLRGLRVPILRASWVRASAAAGCVLPMRHPHAEYDPEIFRSLHFTTTMLPRSLKASVVAAIQFFGGAYSPHFTTATNVLLCADGNVARSAKWRHACERAVPCVSVRWLQECLLTGRRHELPSPPVAVAAACGGDAEREDSCDPSREAARGDCDASLVRRKKRPRADAVEAAHVAAGRV